VTEYAPYASGGRLMLTVLGGLAEFERELILARTSDGRGPDAACGGIHLCSVDRPAERRAGFVGRAGAEYRALTIRVFRARGLLRQRRARRPQCGSANRSLSHIEPVSGMPKRKLENGEQRPVPETLRSWTESPEIAGQRLGRSRLTRRNVGGSHPGNHTPETGLPGWGGRTRTQESVRELCI
jgi:hypothetical protein